MKISTSLYFDRSTQQLSTVRSSLARTQEQLSTGKNIHEILHMQDLLKVVVYGGLFVIPFLT